LALVCRPVDLYRVEERFLQSLLPPAKLGQLSFEGCRKDARLRASDPPHVENDRSEQLQVLCARTERLPRLQKESVERRIQP